jgi:hypothetical protein
VGTLGLLAIGALVTIGARFMGPTNIARGKTVQMSSRRPECPPGSGAQGASPAGLVDGSKGGSYDICTNFEPNPWVTIDLAKEYSLSKIKVYNRGDCCWGAHDLPIVLELSVNGVSYTPQATRSTPFTSAAPWVIDLPGTPARYIKLRAESPEPRELVLSEVEAFAR